MSVAARAIIRFAEKQERAFTVKDAHKALGYSRNYISAEISRLVRIGILERTSTRMPHLHKLASLDGPRG